MIYYSEKVGKEIWSELYSYLRASLFCVIAGIIFKERFSEAET